MYEIIPLTKNNLYEFKKLNDLKNKFNEINKDFFEICDNKNPFQKFLEKRKIKLLKKDSCYIGYIWSENVKKSIYRIQSMFVINRNSNTLLEEYKLLLDSINGYSKLYYDCVKNSFNHKVLNTLSFIRSKGFLEMSLDLSDININPFDKPDYVSFKKVLIGHDEELRCFIQNAIFQSKDRIPLEPRDIYYDEIQDYYFGKGAILIKYGDNYIGYGQIILRNGTPYIVNFGIIQEFREKGYGKILLSYLLNILKENNYNKVNIHVDFNNYSAIKLYKYFGFEIKKETYTWVLNRL
ncbi:GNAT family N-acetyltransferase [Clostridium sp. MB40-C1]|uniref:GNAT family N-acetyltransferase n=1 Tax=Clostridium sp. MB40-C1 TaxID=3070996 RepID=UPI0027DEBE04|nr:GNAT family N-acetyltransferase [Clostridium sp. MB40-C1]WMJ81928.1 GNAT family N-acetyltransferase [Clostridium sp. MB40-C1]